MDRRCTTWKNKPSNVYTCSSESWSKTHCLTALVPYVGRGIPRSIVNSNSPGKFIAGFDSILVMIGGFVEQTSLRRIDYVRRVLGGGDVLTRAGTAAGRSDRAGRCGGSGREVQGIGGRLERKRSEVARLLPRSLFTELFMVTAGNMMRTITGYGTIDFNFRTFSQ